MGFFGRLAQLIKSNLNDLINRAEDPEKMLNQVILDMNQQLVEAKKQVAVAIADEKRLQKQHDNERSVSDEWERKAQMAVRSGDDELAKEALARKKEHDQLASQYKEQWDKQKEAVEQLKTALRALNGKIEEAKRKKNVLVARKRRAEAMKSIQETMSGLTDTSAFDTFDRMSQQIDQVEAEAEAGAEVSEENTGDVLEQRFSQMAQSSQAEEDLEALKSKMGVGDQQTEEGSTERESESPRQRAVAARVEEGESEREGEEPSAEEMAELEEALEELKRREAGGKSSG